MRSEPKSLMDFGERSREDDPEPQAIRGRPWRVVLATTLNAGHPTESPVPSRRLASPLPKQPPERCARGHHCRDKLATTLNAALAESQRADGARAAARARYEAACDDFDRAWTRFAKRMAPLLGDELNAHLPELGPARPRVSDEDTLECPAQEA